MLLAAHMTDHVLYVFSSIEFLDPAELSEHF